MPYNEESVRENLINDPKNCRHVGDLNFLYTDVYIVLWKKEQSYKTIEFICALGLSHEEPQFIKDIDVTVRRKGYTEKQVVRAKFLAFREFMRRVGDKYEDHKAAINGDVYAGVPFATTIEKITELNPAAKKRGRKKKDEQNV